MKTNKGGQSRAAELRYILIALQALTGFTVARIMLEEWDRLLPILTLVGGHTAAMFK